jgi:hypothetical protein
VLRFLSSLFASSVKLPSGVDEELINAATDRVIDGTDIRLRGFGNYRKQLRASVEIAVAHVISMIDALPEPVEISRRSYSTDTRLQAFFTSTSDLQEKVGGARGVADCCKQADDESSGRIYGVLTMDWGETSRLGTVLQGDTIQREVLQLSVNFFKHQYLEPSVSQEESRKNLKSRVFDYIVERALGKIINERSKRAELEVQRTLLNRKLAAMKAGNWGLEQMLSQDEKLHTDLHSLNAEIESVESELISLGASHEVLQRNMQIIKETLSNAEVILGLHNISITLDNMNIKVTDSSLARVNTLDLIELYDDKGEKRILLPGWYPANELPVRNRFDKPGAW